MTRFKYKYSKRYKRFKSTTKNKFKGKMWKLYGTSPSAFKMNDNSTRGCLWH